MNDIVKEYQALIKIIKSDREKIKQERNLLQQRIDKAIEFINEKRSIDYDANCEIIGGYEIDDLLEILKGDE